MTTRSERICPVCGYQITFETITHCPRCGFDLDRADEQKYLARYRETVHQRKTLPREIRALEVGGQEIRTAKNWYWWLWLSPLLTLPAAAVAALNIYNGIGRELACGYGAYSTYFRCDYTLRHRVSLIPAFLISALWHLLLLIPARDGRVFVRWHGRQALALAGLRTAVPTLITLAIQEDDFFWLFIPVLIIIWFAGTWWGRRQARLGECSLMRWTGHQQELAQFQHQHRKPISTEPADPDTLVDIIRYESDLRVRRLALDQLASLGIVESL